MSKRNLFSLS